MDENVIGAFARKTGLEERTCRYLLEAGITPPERIHWIQHGFSSVEVRAILAGQKRDEDKAAC